MPVRSRALGPADVHRFAGDCFAPSTEPCWGLEIEALVGRQADPAVRPGVAELPTTGPLPGGSAVTVEPGGQMELSTPPCPCVDIALGNAANDERALAVRLASVGLVPISGSVDRRRPLRRVLELPRYRAMEAFFDARGRYGRQMMCGTASVHINVDNSANPALRWQLLHRIAPALIATFTTSPGRDRNGVTWAVVRQRIWAEIDPGRTGLPNLTAEPVTTWMRYLLDADVMLLRTGSEAVGLRPGFSFGRWLQEGHELGWPSLDDLRYHASTLFPPVRPRGWMELRVLDALPAEVREVAVLVVAAALLPGVAEELMARLPDPAVWWPVAVRHGLDHPDVARSADLLLDLAAAEAPRVTARPERISALRSFRATHARDRATPGRAQQRADDPATAP